ncbi:hypothetical protein ACP70R_007554 [Stipagrostis hirtigluma subsp. patula]
MASEKAATFGEEEEVLSKGATAVPGSGTDGDQAGSRPLNRAGGDGDTMAAEVDPTNAMVVFHQDATEQKGEEEEDDIIDIDLGEAVEEMKQRWLVIARFYSGKRYNVRALFDDMSAAWGLQQQVPKRDLGDNRFMIEFSSERIYNFVLSGGPWKHKNDAVIVVAYDGISNPSDVCIESMPIWVRIYDLPPVMCTDSFAKVLGGKLGGFMEAGGAVKNYLRIRVSHPLAEPLKTCLKLRVMGVVKPYEVKYENVPFFCFCCGRVGHNENECPEEELLQEEKCFGKELRASPQGKYGAKEQPIPAAKPLAAKALNFSGGQKEKVLQAMHSSSASNKDSRAGAYGWRSPSHKAMDDNDQEPIQVAPEVSNDLARNVGNMRMEDMHGGQNMTGQGWGCREKVSLGNLTSYSSCSSDGEVGQQSLGRKLAGDVNKQRKTCGKVSIGSERKGAGLGPLPGVSKIKKPSRVIKAGIEKSISELRNHGLAVDGEQTDAFGLAQEPVADAHMAEVKDQNGRQEQGNSNQSPVKRMKLASGLAAATNL